MSQMNRLLRTTTTDGLELQGFIYHCQARVDRAVIHIHGLCGNFYENRFIDSIATAVLEEQWHFLSGNTRGHDYVTDIIRQTPAGPEYVQIGGTYELLEEAGLDLDAWITLLAGYGYGRVVLEGHSTGALKAASYALHSGDDRVAGLILLSPSDDCGLQKNLLGDRFEATLGHAEELVRAGRGRELMPADWFEYPISAQTYLSTFRPGSLSELFSSCPRSGRRFKEIASLTIPVLAVYGTENEAVTGPVEEYANLLSAHVARSFEIEIVQGASHSYLGQESRVASVVQKWLQRTFTVPEQGC
jgi:pimeloyl-ACP methyl ester carboxylesterase